MEDPGLILFVSLVLSGSVVVLTLLNTNAAIVVLIFSMLLSPEIRLAQLPERAVVVRFDDLLLGVIFFSWLAKLAVNKQLGVIRSTPLNVPVSLFILCCFLSTGLGLIQGTVTNPAASFFYLVKYVEYFVLYFMVANLIRERRQVELFLNAMLATAVIVCLHAYWQMVHHGPGFRVTAPFEGIAEPNTLAGYLMIVMAVCAGLALYTRSPVWRLLFLGVIAAIVLPFVYTYSRGGYVAFLAMYLTLCLSSRRHKVALLALLILGALTASTLLPETVYERIASTFDPRGAVQIGDVRLAPSPAQRILIWRFIVDRWMTRPLLGFGVTGVGFVDNQNALVLGELGLVGMAAYLWVRWRLLTISYHHFKRLEDPLAQGISLGFFAALIGLLIHSFTGNIFIIVRIMEPFWLLAAVVTVLPKVILSPQQTASPSGSPRLAARG